MKTRIKCKMNKKNQAVETQTNQFLGSPISIHLLAMNKKILPTKNMTK